MAGRKEPNVNRLWSIAGSVAVTALIVVGVSTAVETATLPGPPPPSIPVQQGVPFLPAYVQMLRGERPFPQDTCVAEWSALLPCDTGGR